MGFDGVPKKPPSMVKLTADPLTWGTLSGAVPAIAARTGDSTSWHVVGSGEHCCGVPPCRPDVNVRVTVFDGGAGGVDKNRSGTRTRNTVDEAATTAEGDICTPLTNTLVVEMKFVPVR